MKQLKIAKHAISTDEKISSFFRAEYKKVDLDGRQNILNTLGGKQVLLLTALIPQIWCGSSKVFTIFDIIEHLLSF